MTRPFRRDHDADQLLTVAAASRLTGLHEDTLVRMIGRGELSATSVDGHRRIRREHLLRAAQFICNGMSDIDEKTV